MQMRRSFRHRFRSAVVAAGLPWAAVRPLAVDTQRFAWGAPATATAPTTTIGLACRSFSLNTRRFASTSSTGLGGASGADEDEVFSFDPTASVVSDVLRENQDVAIERIVRALLPANSPGSAIEKARKYVYANPIDEAITATRIVITHVEDETTGEQKKLKLPETSREEAIKSARDQGKHLIQFINKEGVAYCRVRNEQQRLLQHCADELAEILAASAESTAQHQQQRADGGEKQDRKLPRKLRETNDHAFRDVVDAHFIGWKSKAIVKDMERGHPVRLSIQKFQTPDAAIVKMKEMLDAIKGAAQSNGSVHVYTGLHVSDRELAISLSPKTSEEKCAKMTAVRHPSESEWSRAEDRFVAACERSARDSIGTYRKSGTLKPRNMGARQFRTDKYGRRIE